MVSGGGSGGGGGGGGGGVYCSLVFLTFLTKTATARTITSLLCLLNEVTLPELHHRQRAPFWSTEGAYRFAGMGGGVSSECPACSVPP